MGRRWRTPTELAGPHSLRSLRSESIRSPPPPSQAIHLSASKRSKSYRSALRCAPGENPFPGEMPWARIGRRSRLPSRPISRESFVPSASTRIEGAGQDPTGAEIFPAKQPGVHPREKSDLRQNLRELGEGWRWRPEKGLAPQAGDFRAGPFGRGPRALFHGRNISHPVQAPRRLGRGGDFPQQKLHVSDAAIDARAS